MNLRKTIEGTERCIIICKNGQWACTKTEGADYEVLSFYDDIAEAVSGFCGTRPDLDDWERKTVKARARMTLGRETVWVAEWWAKFGPRWLRPFGSLMGQLHKATP